MTHLTAETKSNCHLHGEHQSGFNFSVPGVQGWRHPWKILLGPGWDFGGLEVDRFNAAVEITGNSSATKTKWDCCCKCVNQVELVANVCVTYTKWFDAVQIACGCSSETAQSVLPRGRDCVMSPQLVNRSCWIRACRDSGENCASSRAAFSLRWILVLLCSNFRLPHAIFSTLHTKSHNNSYVH